MLVFVLLIVHRGAEDRGLFERATGKLEADWQVGLIRRRERAILALK
jgi:hypothetical protein